MTDAYVPKRFALVDDRLVEDSLFLRRSLGQATLRQPDPILRKAEAFGSVLRDHEGQWRMWYCWNIARDPAKHLVEIDATECLALSRDGVNWEYPNWGVVEEGGSKQNSAVLGPHFTDRNGRSVTGYGGPAGFCVIDAQTHPHPAARGRFTAMFHASPSDTIGGICLAYSDDGVHWTAYPENPVNVGSQDTQNCFFYDTRIGKYVCYQRPTIHCGVEAHANRRIARVVSDDLVNWSVSRMVLDTDERDAPAFDAFDEPGMRGPRGRDKQFQGITVFPYNDTYLGFAWFYDVIQATFAIELVHSDDGIAWKREALREPLIADGNPPGFDGKLIVPIASPPVPVGDELYLYMSTTPYDHHAIALMLEKAVGEERKEILERNDLRLLSIKRDRFVCYEAGSRRGELLTAPIDWKGDGKLLLNASVEPGGSITVSFEDQWARPIRDWHLDEIPVITGPLDATDHVLTFGPGPKSIIKLPPVGPIRMRFFLERAKLYGWTLTSPA